MAKSNQVGFNANRFIKSSDECVNHTVDQVVDETTPAEPKRKRATKKKEMVKEVSNTNAPINFLQTDISYMEAYKDTNDQLDHAILQLDTLGGTLFNELETIRGSKTLKNKYNYINDMVSTTSGIISAKISAIKEKNKTINDVNNLELRRMKELKASQSQEDDNTKIMNLYDAFINTPVGVYGGANGGSPTSILGPSMADLTLSGGAPDLGRVTINGDTDQVNWEAGLDPAQNRMVLEAKGAIETVVFFDEASGNRWFEVVDKNTRQPVPNVEKPSETRLYELDINLRGGFAKDPNTNMTYPLVVVNGGDTSILEY